MLELKNLSIKYDDVKVIDNVNFTINNGEICVFLGFTGSGKTSIFNAITNLIDYDGEIIFNKKPIINKDVKIAMSTQHYDLYNFKNIYQNIILGLKIKKMPIDKCYIENLMKSYGMYEHKNKYPNELSGGQKQKVSFLRSIVQNPSLFLLDEPFSALDYFTREEMQKELLNYLDKQKCTTLLITHSIEEALYLGDKIIILGDNPSTIIEAFDNEKGLDKTSDGFLQKVKETRKLFNI
ncbi:MAG: ABC transporter ATP-binding protein [Lachnospirales bacterium]